MDQQLLQARAMELEQLLARLAPGEASRRPCASCAAIWNHADPLHLNIICCFQVIES